MKVICEYCNKEFEKPFKYVNQQKKRYFHTFCSRECSAKSRRNRIKVNCDQCGKELLLTPYDINKTKSGKNYCSKRCANIGKPRNFKHGINSYRRNALNYYGDKCYICGYNVRQVLEVHHKDNNRKNNNIENLIVLCPTHHVEIQLGLVPSIAQQ